MPPCYLPATAFLYLAFTGKDRSRSLLGGNMKKTGLLLLLIATAGWGQSTAQGAAVDQTTPEGTIVTSASFPTVRFQTPTYADVYCAGFISKQTLPDANFVARGLQ